MNAWAAFFFRNPLRAWYVTTRHLTRSNSPSAIWQLQRENVSIGTLFARGCENIRASSTLRPRCHEYSKKGKGLKGEMEITSGRRQRFDEWEGGLNKQLVIRPPHIYGNKGTSRKLARGRVFGFFRVQPRNSIRFMISKRDHKLFDVPASIFRGKTKEWKISIGDSVRVSLVFEVFFLIVLDIWKICATFLLQLSYYFIYIDKNDLIIWNNI